MSALVLHVVTKAKVARRGTKIVHFRYLGQKDCCPSGCISSYTIYTCKSYEFFKFGFRHGRCSGHDMNTIFEFSKNIVITIILDSRIFINVNDIIVNFRPWKPEKE
jgi:hypothetical protein